MMGIAQKISRNFTDAVRSRGQSYFAKGRVIVSAAVAGEVIAKVRGTAKYRVRLRIRGSKLHVSCTCPYFTPTGDPCKHIWATVLVADARNLLQAPPVRPLKVVSDMPRRSAANRAGPGGPGGGGGGGGQARAGAAGQGPGAAPYFGPGSNVYGSGPGSGPGPGLPRPGTVPGRTRKERHAHRGTVPAWTGAGKEREP